MSTTHYLGAQWAGRTTHYMGWVIGCADELGTNASSICFRAGMRSTKCDPPMRVFISIIAAGAAQAKSQRPRHLHAHIGLT